MKPTQLLNTHHGKERPRTEVRAVSTSCRSRSILVLQSRFRVLFQVSSHAQKLDRDKNDPRSNFSRQPLPNRLGHYLLNGSFSSPARMKYSPPHETPLCFVLRYFCTAHAQTLVVYIADFLWNTKSNYNTIMVMSARPHAILRKYLMRN